MALLPVGLQRRPGPVMLDLATEREHLAKAERDIAEGETRISHQVELIEQLRQGGHGLCDAERLLATFQQTLGAWQNHREEILRAIARLEGEEPPAASPIPPV